MSNLWNGPIIQVIGLGPQGDLGAEAKNAIFDCDLLFGSKRQLELLNNFPLDKPLECKLYPSPLQDLAQALSNYENKKLCLLTSGDPLFFGFGSWLIKHLGKENLNFHANLSSVQIACARLKLPWQDLTVISLHGRPIHQLRPLVNHDNHYAIFTDCQNHPAAIAQYLADIGFAQSEMWVLEDLDGDKECIRHYSCAQLVECSSGDFHTPNLVIAKVMGLAKFNTTFPGFDDKLFITEKENGGMISKRPVRLMALSLLQTQSNQVAWDVGAGCGALSSEWARWHAESEIFAIEKDRHRFDKLQANRNQFGLQNLHCIHAEAPLALENLPTPHRIFVGGNAGKLLDILQVCWQKLAINGILVVSLISESSRHQAYEFSRNHAGQWHSLQYSRSENQHPLVLKPNIPVTLVEFVKTN